MLNLKCREDQHWDPAGSSSLFGAWIAGETEVDDILLFASPEDRGAS